MRIKTHLVNGQRADKLPTPTHEQPARPMHSKPATYPPVGAAAHAEEPATADARADPRLDRSAPKEPWCFAHQPTSGARAVSRAPAG